MPGYPPRVELVDVVLVPWVDDRKCHGTRECNVRLAYSMRASGLIAPAGASRSTT